MYTLDNAPLTPEQHLQVRNAIASSAVENIHLGEDTVDRMIRIILGECTPEEAKAEVLHKYGITTDAG
ncbi:hypothetical protein CMUST_15500 (plasmid) [Corynebacterium mustelae]|uniref:Uncharacterized protein n=1 Tax=Corynebacterium mustelae TaxID=571915 RepID=A0A0G3H1U8_9CORY|nr:antitoxin VbhA family protein [Corynebacterium mustelae]AKK07389.1 hypothetical protein CMUST_15500 [Corynebacterium mustelae]